MNVYVTKMRGGEYEDRWETVTGIHSSEKKALEEFERCKEMYALGKEIDSRLQGDEELPEQENELWDFYWDNEDWYWFEINEYEVDGEFVSQRAWIYNNEKEGDWNELNRQRSYT